MKNQKANKKATDKVSFNSTPLSPIEQFNLPENDRLKSFFYILFSGLLIVSLISAFLTEYFQVEPDLTLPLIGDFFSLFKARFQIFVYLYCVFTWFSQYYHKNYVKYFIGAAIAIAFFHFLRVTLELFSILILLSSSN